MKKQEKAGRGDHLLVSSPSRREETHMGCTRRGSRRVRRSGKWEAGRPRVIPTVRVHSGARRGPTSTNPTINVGAAGHNKWLRKRDARDNTNAPWCGPTRFSVSPPFSRSDPPYPVALRALFTNIGRAVPGLAGMVLRAISAKESRGSAPVLSSPPKRRQLRRRRNESSAQNAGGLNSRGRRVGTRTP